MWRGAATKTKKAATQKTVNGALVDKPEPKLKLPEGFPVSKPRGTHDILPEEQKYWEYVIETGKSIVRGWHYQQIDTPIFEETILYKRAVGDNSDIVQKEMFELKPRGKGTHYVLRPEGTSAVMRAYIEHGMRSWPKPVKLFYYGPNFRYDRPQAGRQRQFNQFSIETLGSSAPITDAQVIYVAHLWLQQLGLEDYIVRINSIGLPDERQEYIKLLKEHYRSNRSKLCKTCKSRLTTNPLRLLDCKEEKCQQLANTAPKLLDHLSDESKKHFDSVLNALEKLEVPHEIDPKIVRGLDYYTHTVFEFVPTNNQESQQATLIGGGRYDGLIRYLGGKNTPGIGWSAGLERIIDQLKAEGVELTATDKPQVFVVQLGEDSQVEALRVMKLLREADIPFAESIHREGIQAQLRGADRMNVAWTIIIGHKEVLDKTVILRNMESGMQEVINQDELGEELGGRLNIVDA